jgi:hypothetical protein
MEATAAPTPHDRTRYEGKNLFRLLLALGGPAFILFLRIVLAIAMGRSAATASDVAWLNRGSYAILAAFFVVELFCARYVQGLLRPARTQLSKAVQYAGVLLLCLFISVCGAVACEAFGYAVFLRVGPR